jgi:hypothetical protein
MPPKFCTISSAAKTIKLATVTATGFSRRLMVGRRLPSLAPAASSHHPTQLLPEGNDKASATLKHSFEKQSKRGDVS